MARRTSRSCELGRSKSYGTSHLSSRVSHCAGSPGRAEQDRGPSQQHLRRGVNPKLRKVRSGLDLLGWPAEELLQHGRQRIVYGISLVSNLLPYLSARTNARLHLPARKPTTT